VEEVPGKIQKAKLANTQKRALLFQNNNHYDQIHSKQEAYRKDLTELRFILITLPS
jgi:hypothetical protein